MSRKGGHREQDKLQTSFQKVDVTSTVETQQTLANKERWWSSLKDSISKAFNVKPIHVHGQDDWRTEHYKVYLSNIIKSLIKIKVDADWNIDYFKDNLLFIGKICVTEIEGTNYALGCGTHGVSVYDRENFITIANPILGNHERINGIDASIIYLMSSKYSWNFSETVDIFACKLAMCDSAIDVNLLNSKVAFAVRTANKKQADEAKMLYDKVSAGEPIVFYGNDSIDLKNDMDFFKNDVRQNYVANDIQQTKRAIIDEFLTAIGINNGNTEKKERMLYDEVNSNNMEIRASISYCEEMVKACVKNVNKLYPYLNLSITFPYLDDMRKKEAVRLDKHDGNTRTDGNKTDGKSS